MKVKTLVLTAVALNVLALPAMAADMPVKAPVYKAIAPESAWNWTGFYAGVNGGYSWGRTDATLLAGTANATLVRQDANGWLGGGQVGYNRQIDRKWVVGVEADIQGTGERGSNNVNVFTGRLTNPANNTSIVTTLDSANSWKLPWFATFRGRAGVLVTPEWLIYGTGGLAVGEVRYATQLTATLTPFAGAVQSGPALSAVGPLFAESKTRVGWTLGVGTERKFGKNWSAKLEYLYVDLGSSGYLFNTVSQTDVGFRDHILRAGINYAFDSGAVVAKY